jgi:hypothetical protein
VPKLKFYNNYFQHQSPELISEIQLRLFSDLPLPELPKNLGQFCYDFKLTDEDLYLQHVSQARRNWQMALTARQPLAINYCLASLSKLLLSRAIARCGQIPEPLLPCRRAAVPHTARLFPVSRRSSTKSHDGKIFLIDASLSLSLCGNIFLPSAFRALSSTASSIVSPIGPAVTYTVVFAKPNGHKRPQSRRPRESPTRYPQRA